jgi:hypothetical protein
VLAGLFLLAIVLCTGATACERTADPTPSPHPACAAILPLGDSITQGRSTYPGYRRDLWQMLAEGGYDVDFVGSLSRHHEQSRAPAPGEYDPDHDGHWGWRADEILDGASWLPEEGRLGDWLVGYTPDVALIHLGTNDVWQDEPASETVADLERVVDTLRADNPGVVILLAQLVPTDATWDDEAMAALNDEIPNVAARRSTPESPIVVVDQRVDFDPLFDTWDGAHPGATGAKKMARRWYDALAPYLADCVAE